MQKSYKHAVLNFRPISNPLLKNVCDTPDPRPFSSAGKNLRAYHPLWVILWSPKKSIYVGMILLLDSVISGPKMTNAKEITIDQILVRL